MASWREGATLMFPTMPDAKGDTAEGVGKVCVRHTPTLHEREGDHAG